MENNKSLMTLYRDFLAILAGVEIDSGLNTLSEILIAEKSISRESDQSIAKWNLIHKEIEGYNNELTHYRLNMINNPAVYQRLDINKLTEYRNRTISGLRMIKRNAIHVQIAEDLLNSCNLLLNLIADAILLSNPAELSMPESVYDLKIISTEDISANFT
jgi:hypothetical protein